MRKKPMFSALLLGSLLVMSACQADPVTPSNNSATDTAGGSSGGDAGASTDAGSGTDAGNPSDAGGSSDVSVIIKTSMGEITVLLNASKAPVTVANFLSYVDKKHYDGLLFHRVIAGFMIQGGGLLPSGQQKQTDAPIKNEATNGLQNKRGTIAMARTNVINSATSQFFINLVDNAFLDHSEPTQKGYGYAVFGEVTAGLDVVDKIGATKTTGKGGNPPDKPLQDVMITSIRRK